MSVAGKQDITVVGSNANAGDTVTIPAHVAGDKIYIFAYRDGSNSVPTVPAPFGAVAAGTGANSNSSVVGSYVAVGSGTTSGTWSNATHLIVIVVRGASSSAGAIAGSGVSNNTVIPFPTLSMVVSDGSSLVVGVIGHRTATNVETAPSGMTFVNGVGSAPESAMHATGYVSSWSSTNVTVNTTGAARTWTFEILAAASNAVPVFMNQYRQRVA